MVTKTDVIKYTVLPGFLPRIMDLFKSGFAHIAFLVACIFRAVQLLPPSHPYLDPQNFGRFGIRHVLAEAANNLVFKRENTDQVILFFMILLGLVLLFSQFAVLVMSVIMGHPSYALSTVDLLGNPAAGNAVTGALGPHQDIAFILLDRIFGVPGIFNSCVADLGITCTDLNGIDLPSSRRLFPFLFI